MDEIVYKILLLGDSTVGKSSLMIRFTDNYYEENNVSTFGVDSKKKIIEINNQKIRLNIYDTCGQERYRSLAKNFLQNSNGIIFVFDLTNGTTFDNIERWLMTCDDVIGDFQKIVVGNKLDLENREIDKERAVKFCKEHNLKYFETSAKKDINVERIFKEIARLILDSKQKNEKIEVKGKDKEKENSQKITKLTNKKDESKKKKKCC